MKRHRCSWAGTACSVLILKIQINRFSNHATGMCKIVRNCSQMTRRKHILFQTNDVHHTHWHAEWNWVSTLRCYLSPNKTNMTTWRRSGRHCSNNRFAFQGKKKGLWKRNWMRKERKKRIELKNGMSFTTREMTRQMILTNSRWHPWTHHPEHGKRWVRLRCECMTWCVKWLTNDWKWHTN